MKAVKKGAVVIGLSIVALIAIYSFRPPSGIGDAIMMMSEGRDFFFEESTYYTLIAISITALVYGVMTIVDEKKTRAKK